MDMSINMATDQFKRRIVDEINRSGLPIVCIDYVMTEIANTVKADYLATIQKESKLMESMEKARQVEQTKVVQTGEDRREFGIIPGAKEA